MLGVAVGLGLLDEADGMTRTAAMGLVGCACLAVAGVVPGMPLHPTFRACPPLRALRAGHAVTSKTCTARPWPAHPQARRATMQVLSASFWLSSLGALGVLIVTFAETGLLIGFFLPGDSLLFTAGVLCASSGALPLSLPLVLLAAAAGAQLGFVLGRRGNRALLARVRNDHLHRGVERAETLFSRYGHGKAIVLARFIPIVRTVLNPLAGVLDVPTRVVTLWQIVGGLVRSIGVTLAGYLLGRSIPGVDQYLLPVIAVIVVVSLIPMALELWRARRVN
jgi:membrane-associated protein